jgi:hypothetical protein
MVKCVVLLKTFPTAYHVPKTEVVCKIYELEKLRYQLIHRGSHDF